MSPIFGVNPVQHILADLAKKGQGSWFLGASTEWPGVVPADVEIGKLDELAGKNPKVAADLRAIAASVQHVD